MVANPGSASLRLADTSELVAACRRGDRRAWEQVIDRYERLVYAIPLREGLHRDDAADVTQETFAALFKGLHTIREPDRLAYWLMTVARRLTYRVRNGRPLTEVNLAEYEPGLDETAVDETLQTLWVYEAIVQLDEPCRSLILGLFFDPAEPSYGEIALQLGRPLGSIGPLRARCLERLRVLLEGA
jgi:RNA polymerase sigma factor (sigma-70 family)